MSTNWTIQTSDGPRNLHVCKDGDSKAVGWTEVYESSFPEGQRQGLDAICAAIEAGTMELDETRDQDDQVLCMTLTEVFNGVGPKFLLACYTATRPELRSMGIGSLHRRRLVELLREEYPNHLGLFSEIESTREPGLDPSTRALRLRRLEFSSGWGLSGCPSTIASPATHLPSPRWRANCSGCRSTRTDSIERTCGKF